MREVEIYSAFRKIQGLGKYLSERILSETSGQVTSEAVSARSKDPQSKI